MTHPTKQLESVFDHLHERATGMQRPEEFRSPVVARVQESETGRIEPLGFATRREYELTALVTCTYWANDAQRVDCRRNAERVLADALYRDVLVDLSAITHAIYDGDQANALRMVGALQTRLRR